MREPLVLVGPMYLVWIAMGMVDCPLVDWIGVD
jgi:hypothetical protein